jgi:hypothetical protein
MLLRWKLVGVWRSGEVFFNKRIGATLFGNWSSALLPLLLTCRGGEGIERFGLLFCGFEEDMGKSKAAGSWSSSLVAFLRRPTQDAGGQQLLATTQVRLALLNLHRRPPYGFAAAALSLLPPSGFVPGAGVGGRRWSPVNHGGVGGLDCFSEFCFRVRGVKFEDCFLAYVFVEVLYVICTAPFDV